MRQRGTRRSFQVTEAAKHQILVPEMVRSCGKASRRSELKKLMEASVFRKTERDALGFKT